MVQIERKLLDSGGLSYMSKTQSVKTKLQTFHDRVKAAAPGYSGFAKRSKLDAEELERLYSFDEALIRYNDKFDEALDTLEQAASSNEGVDDAIAALDKLTTRSERSVFAARRRSDQYQQIIVMRKGAKRMPRIIDVIDHTNVGNDELAYREPQRAAATGAWGRR